MKTWGLFLLLFLGTGGFQKIAEINAHSQKAAIAFRQKNFAEAVKNYEYLVYEIGDMDPRLLLNLAHSYRLNNQLDKAQKIYEQCAKTPHSSLRSIAWEQLGTLSAKIENYSEALTFYKRALIANPTNEQARYNYEMLKKYLREHPEEQNKIPPPAPEKKEKQEEKKPQPKEQEKQKQSEKPDQVGDQEKEDKDQQEKGNQQQKPEKQTNPQNQNKPEQEKPGGENGKEKEQKQGSEKGNEQGLNTAENQKEEQPEKPAKSGGRDAASGNEQRLQTQYERLRKANISPEQAEMMLDAMRSSEKQFLQQMPKKATKKKDRSKPDW